MAKSRRDNLRCRAAVMTSITPGRARTAAVSIRLTTAWACGLRATTAWTMPSTRRSSMNIPAPVKKRESSRRSTARPTNLPFGSRSRRDAAFGRTRSVRSGLRQSGSHCSTSFAGQNKHRMNPCAKVFREGGNSIKRNTISYTETIIQEGHFANILPAATRWRKKPASFVDGDGLASAPRAIPARMKPELVHLAHLLPRQKTPWQSRGGCYRIGLQNVIPFTGMRADCGLVGLRVRAGRHLRLEVVSDMTISIERDGAVFHVILNST